jgi:hypothetical protein
LIRHCIRHHPGMCQWVGLTTSLRLITVQRFRKDHWWNLGPWGSLSEGPNTNFRSSSNAPWVLFIVPGKALLSRVPFGKFNRAGREGFLCSGDHLLGLVRLRRAVLGSLSRPCFRSME